MADRIEINPRKGPEVMGFYRCVNPRCAAIHFPVTVGDHCPACDQQGVYAGMVAKYPAPPPVSDGDGELD